MNIDVPSLRMTHKKGPNYVEILVINLKNSILYISAFVGVFSNFNY